MAGRHLEEDGDSPKAPPGSSLPRRKILVVDDNSDTVDSEALLLQMLGQTVQRAYDGPSALKLAAQWDPEIVILDLEMPGVSGFDVARQLRGMPKMSSTRLVAHSGFNKPDHRAAAWSAGFDEFLLKPSTAAQLSAIISRPFPAPLLVVVDDDESDRALVIQALRESQLGYRTQELSGGPELLDFLLRRGPFRDAVVDGQVIVLLDLGPGGGIGTVTELKKHPKLAGIPVALLTRSKDEGDRVMAQFPGSSLALPKPAGFSGHVDMVLQLDSWIQSRQVNHRA